ncbi:MAG: DUF349 domain-containing protein [Pseudomonadota bacterium]|nr:MAG: DUF349 domain-containing protein [Pseudomonadota bacterium]
MNLKSRIFGQPWEHRDPQVRAQAVREGHDDALIERIGQIAEHDESPLVRLTALQRINNEAFWLDARLRESDPDILAAADQFLRRSIMRKADPEMIKERLEWFRRIDDPDWIRQVARHAPDTALRAAALERIDAQGFLGDCYATERDNDLAAAVLARIEQESTLERIAASLRKSNKGRARAVDARLRELRIASGQLDAQVAPAEALVKRAEALARGDFSGSRKLELSELRSEWQGLEQAPEGLARRFHGAIAIARRALERPDSDPTIPTAEAPAADPPDQGADQKLLAVATRLEGLDSTAQLDPGEAGQLLGDWDRAWSHISAPTEADRLTRERVLPVLKALQRRREAHLQTPDRQAQQAVGPDFVARVDQIAELLEAGNMAGAQKHLRETRSAFDRLPRRQQTSAIGGRLHRLEGRLHEMRNWEHWSNNKIRDELIAQVEALAGSEQHPDAITAALKSARREWQRLESLEVLPGDKRQHAAPAGQWRRFQSACKAAFEQAKPYFEQRSAVQEANLEQLKRFLEQAHQAADDESSATDRLQELMHTARQAIRRLDDLPPKSRGSSAARLRELMDHLSARLDSEFEAVEKVKRQLVAEARGLTHVKDLSEAIEQAKALQARWQAAGRGRRRIEQKLWKAFREPIDPLFEQLRGKQQETQAEQREHSDQLRGLCEQAETLAQCDTAELEDARGRMRGLRDEWSSAGRRPRSLEQRFERAEQQLRQRLTEQRRAARQAARQRFDHIAETIQAIWQQRQRGAVDEATIEQLPDCDAKEDPLLDELAATARRLADEAVSIDALAKQVEQNGQAARQIAIEMEFLAGLDSPNEDRDARMAYQVDRLAKRLGDRDRSTSLVDELNLLRRRWYQSFPHPVDQHELLAKRFDKCQTVVDSMTGKE